MKGPQQGVDCQNSLLGGTPQWLYMPGLEVGGGGESG